MSEPDALGNPASRLMHTADLMKTIAIEQQRTNHLLAHVCDQLNQLNDEHTRLVDAVLQALDEGEDEGDVAYHLDGTVMTRGTHDE